MTYLKFILLSDHGKQRVGRPTVWDKAGGQDVDREFGMVIVKHQSLQKRTKLEQSSHKSERD